MLNVGDECYYIDQNNHNIVTKAKIIKETGTFFILDAGYKEQRKKKKNVSATEDELIAETIARANLLLREEYGINIVEAYKRFNKAIEEFPEKFV